MHHLEAVSTSSALVLADDTDIFVLLCHFSCITIFKCPIWMASPISGRSVLDTTKSVSAHTDVMGNILAMHCISGCVTVAPYYGISKTSALKVLKRAQYPLNKLGDPHIDFNEVISESREFILACYNVLDAQSMNEARKKLWIKRKRKKSSKCPKT